MGILGLAARNALSQVERVALELGEIEEDARLARAMIDVLPPETAALSEARRHVSAAEKTVAEAQDAVAVAAGTTSALKRERSWWQRTIGLFTGENAHHAARQKAAAQVERDAQAALTKARNDRRTDEIILSAAIQRHKDAVQEHIEQWTERAKAAEAKSVAAGRAREILQRLPGAAALGPAGLHQLGVKFPKQKRPRRPGSSPDDGPSFQVPF